MRKRKREGKGKMKGEKHPNKKVNFLELFPATYDKGLAFGRFVLGSMIYSRPRVLVIFAAIDRETKNEVVVCRLPFVPVASLSF